MQNLTTDESGLPTPDDFLRALELSRGDFHKLTCVFDGFFPVDMTPEDVCYHIREHMTDIEATNEDDAAYLREYDDLCDRVGQMTDEHLTAMMFFVAGCHFAAELDT